MRALVISDTHFGAWTGEDLLREPETLALLEPELDVDEVILLGDMFDFMFGSMRDAFGAAEGLLDLLRAKLQGKRFVFLAGNHDHHLVVREAEDLLGLELATGRSRHELAEERGRADFFRVLLENRLAGVEVDVRYPTYTFAGVLCTHGHYLDFHARRSGAAPGRLLARVLWSIAVGGKEHTPTIDDYEATITLLTALLYTIAQLPNGTHAQRRAFASFQTLGRAARLGRAPVDALQRAYDWLAAHAGASGGNHGNVMRGVEAAQYQGARSHEAQRRERSGAPGGSEVASHVLARSVAPSDPSSHALVAFEKVVLNLGWSHEADKIVFAHTHQPLDGVTATGGRVRYWNPGSWIYEPDLSSRDSYIAYLRNAWPGTAVLIDEDEDAPRLLRLRDHLNPLHRNGTAA
jgi:UDP-2,3-diacylglucosamine pyrophosphatase LpxH